MLFPTNRGRLLRFVTVPSPTGGSRRLELYGMIAFRTQKRQANYECRTNTNRRVEGNGAVMFLHDCCVRKRKALAATLPNLLSSEEWVEDARSDFRWDASPGVRNPNFCARIRHTSRDANGALR